MSTSGSGSEFVAQPCPRTGVSDVPRLSTPEGLTLGPNRLTERFVIALHGRAITQVRTPIRLNEYTEPQPDLSLVRPEAADYPARPENVLLVVEVAQRCCATTGG